MIDMQISNIKYQRGKQKWSKMWRPCTSKVNSESDSSQIAKPTVMSRQLNKVNTGIKCMDCNWEVVQWGHASDASDASQRRLWNLQRRQQQGQQKRRPMKAAQHQSSHRDEPNEAHPAAIDAANPTERRHQVTCSASNEAVVFSLSFLPAVLIVYFGKPQGLCAVWRFLRSVSDHPQNAHDKKYWAWYFLEAWRQCLARPQPRTAAHGAIWVDQLCAVFESE